MFFDFHSLRNITSSLDLDSLIVWINWTAHIKLEHNHLQKNAYRFLARLFEENESLYCRLGVGVGVGVCVGVGVATQG